MSQTGSAHPATGKHREDARLKMAVGAIGIVFGDIGTSPLYAFRETFVGRAAVQLDNAHVLGVISLIFWSMDADRGDPICQHPDARR